MSGWSWQSVSVIWKTVEYKMAILRKIARALRKTARRVKLIDKRNDQKHVSTLNLKEIFIFKANGLQRSWHLKRDRDNMLRKTLNFEVFETKKRGQPKIK